MVFSFYLLHPSSDLTILIEDFYVLVFVVESDKVMVLRMGVLEKGDA